MFRYLLFLSAVHSGKGFPLGPYSSSPFNEESIEVAIEKCNKNISCAGLTVIPNYKNSSMQEFVAHTFLPNATEHTYQSSNKFTFQPGRVKDSSIISVRYGDMLIEDAKSYCLENPLCVAFFYPVHSLQLEAPDNITFVATLDDFQPSKEDTWRTFVVNDIDRAPHVNAHLLQYYDDVFEKPYLSCCTRTEIPPIPDIQIADTLERVPCTIPREIFREKYEFQRKPVMLVGCDKEWKARDRWIYEKLIQRFDNNTDWTATTEESDEYDSIKWSTIVDSIRSNKIFYIFDNLDHPAGKEIEEDFTVPAPFENLDLYGNLKNFPPDYGPMRWFCVGTGGTGMHPFTEPYSTDSWNTLIRGHQWWIINPNSVTNEEVLQCDKDCSVPDPTPRHWYASVGINAARSEYSHGERPYHVLQKPGETIYLPSGYIHSLLNMDDTIAVTANYGSAGNFNDIWQEIVTNGNDQHWKTAYHQFLNKEQRRRARESYYWHPDEFFEEDSEDSEESEDEEDEEDEENEEDSEESEDQKDSVDEVRYYTFTVNIDIT